MKKIKIIVSDTAPLYPPSWGGPKRIWGLYNNLTKEFFDIDYIGISKQQFGEKIYEVNKIIVKDIEENYKEIFSTQLSLYGGYFVSKLWEIVISMKSDVGSGGRKHWLQQIPSDTR